MRVGRLSWQVSSPSGSGGEQAGNPAGATGGRWVSLPVVGWCCPWDGKWVGQPGREEREPCEEPLISPPGPVPGEPENAAPAGGDGLGGAESSGTEVGGSQSPALPIGASKQKAIEAISSQTLFCVVWGRGKLSRPVDHAARIRFTVRAPQSVTQF